MQLLNNFLDYHYAESRELWQRVDALDEATFETDAGYSIGSLRREMVHLILADQLWLARMKGEPVTGLLDYASDRETILTTWDRVEADVRAFAADLTEAQAQQTVAFSNKAGETEHLKIFDMLLHMVNHGTVHRAEICAMLHMLGHTLDFDVSFYRYLASR